MTQFALMCATILAQNAIDARNVGVSAPVVDRATQQSGCFDALVRAVSRRFDRTGGAEHGELGPDDRATDDVVATLETHPELVEVVLAGAVDVPTGSSISGTDRLRWLRQRLVALTARSGVRRVLVAGS